MAVITMKQLLEAGVHFGHQTRKWNPKMKKYIFAARNDIHIIDLQLTANLIEEAYTFVCDSVKAGKSVLFVGTKKQAQDAIKEEAERCGQYYVNSRWLGGCLTNFKTMRSRVERLEKLEAMCERYLNAMWFSGHSHWEWCLQKYQDRANIFRTYSGTLPTSGWCVHIPSCGVPRTSDGSSRSDVKAGSEAAIVEEISADEPSVIISRRPCALLKYVKAKPSLVVDPNKCRSCKACMKIGCPAISIVDGKAKIDATQCVGCGVCEQLCKFGALKEV